MSERYFLYDDSKEILLKDYIFNNEQEAIEAAKLLSKARGGMITVFHEIEEVQAKED